MKNKIRISEEYRNKIKIYFVRDWYGLGIAILIMSYSLIVDKRQSLYFSGILFIVFSIHFFFIAPKVKSRLIYEVIEEPNFYSLIIYNKTVVTLDKKLIPVPKEGSDYYLNSLFVPNGTINIPKAKAERFIVTIDNKKYYFLPLLFEEEILI